MYADRYANRRGLNPGGLAFALGASGVLLFGLSLSAPHFVERIDKVLTAHNIPIDQPPPPKPEPIKQPQIKLVKQVQTPPREPVDVTVPLTQPTSGSFTSVHIDSPPVVTLAPGTGSDTGLIVPSHVPVIGAPELDPRYADAFQPNYPSDERLAGHEGRVVVRVLIGADGRVKDVQQVSAATTAFFEATRKQALAKWRFKPGTRDGVAVEAWRTMAVRFVLDQD